MIFVTPTKKTKNAKKNVKTKKAASTKRQFKSAYRKKNEKEKKSNGFLYWVFNNSIGSFLAILALMVFVVTFALLFGGYFEKSIINFNSAKHNFFTDIGLKYEKLIIIGRNKTPRKDILLAINSDFNGSIYELNLKQIHENLQNLPWIKKAKVVRILPDKLYVSIEERYPVAVWDKDDISYLIDKEGVLIQPINSPQPEYLHFIGKSPPLNFSELIDQLFKASYLSDYSITSVIDNSLFIDLIISNNGKKITIRMNNNDLEENFTHIKWLIENDLFSKDYELVDLRNKDKISLR